VTTQERAAQETATQQCRQPGCNAPATLRLDAIAGQNTVRGVAYACFDHQAAVGNTHAKKRVDNARGFWSWDRLKSKKETP
jgi:hypothetical protein